MPVPRSPFTTVVCIVFVFTMMHALVAPLLAQSGLSNTRKPGVAPAKPTAAPPRMSAADVTKPAADSGHKGQAPGGGKVAGHGEAAAATKAAEPAKPAEHAKAPEPQTAAAPVAAAVHMVTPGRSRRQSAERAVKAVAAALSVRRDHVAATRHTHAAAAPEEPLPPPPPPVRRPAPRRHVAAPRPPAPPVPRYDVPWPSRIVDVHWPAPPEHRVVSWPSDKPDPIELRWDLKALQSDLSEPTAAVGR